MSQLFSIITALAFPSHFLQPSLPVQPRDRVLRDSAAPTALFMPILCTLLAAFLHMLPGLFLIFFFAPKMVFFLCFSGVADLFTFLSASDLSPQSPTFRFAEPRRAGLSRVGTNFKGFVFFLQAKGNWNCDILTL